MSLEKENEMLKRAMDRLSRGNEALEKIITDLRGQVEFLDGQLKIAIGQKGISEMGNDIQDAITQQAIGGANQINQNMAAELVAAHQRVRKLEGLLEEAGINPNGNNH